MFLCVQIKADCFCNCEIVVLSSLKLVHFRTEKPELFFINDGPSLIDLLGGKDWALAEARLSDMGVPGFFGAKFQPWYMNLTLAVPPCAFAVIQAGGKGLDRQIHRTSICIA